MDVKKVFIAVATTAPFFLLGWPSDSLHLESTGDHAHLEVPSQALPSPSTGLDVEQALATMLKSESLDLAKLKEILSGKPNLRFRFREDGSTPLTMGIHRGWGPAVLRPFLDAGADPNFPDSDGLTPLAHVTLGQCDEDGEEIARALLEKSARVSDYLDFTRVYGATYYTLPFEVWRDTKTRKVSFVESALYHNRRGECIRLLLARGAAVDRYAYALWKETRQDLAVLDLHRPIF